MNSRMEKYIDKNDSSGSRIEKNKKLYEEVSTINVDYIDINSVNSSNVLEIPLTKSATTVKTRENYQRLKELGDIISLDNEMQEANEEEIKDNRIYDINEILKKAKAELKEDESKKRLINTEYNILTKLDIEKITDEQDLKEEEIKEIVQKVYPKVEKADDNKDLFEDLKESDLKKEILEKPTEDITLSKENELDKEKELEKEIEKQVDSEKTVNTEIIEINKKSRLILAFIITIVILLIGVLTYLLLKYFSII